MVLPADDPWWDEHYPPKEWGCKCKVVSHSKEELERDGWNIAEKAPKDGTYEWTNPDTGEVKTIPKGVDPGFNYPIGKAAWGQRLSEDVMNEWKAQGAKAYEKLTYGNWESYELTEKIAADKARARVDDTIPKTKTGIENYLIGMLGGAEKIFTFKDKDFPEFRHDILINAKTLADHIKTDRAPYLPFLKEAVEDPQEIWLSFERHKGTGKIFLRQRFIKVIEAEGERAMVIVTQSNKGMMESWTVIPVTDMDYVNEQRSGRLIWKK